MTDAWTYGCELEWSDVNRAADLSGYGAAWSSSDYTIVNSCGVANDPTGKLHSLGGEVNTAVCDSPANLAHHVDTLVNLLGPASNYRANLHIHVGVPGLADDLDALRKLAYAIPAARTLVLELDPLERLIIGLPSVARPAGKKRLQHSERSRHLFYSPTTMLDRLDARNVADFMRAGPPGYGARECINLRSLRKHGTIEFRHFAGTTDPGEVGEAARWCRDWLAVALGLSPRMPDEPAGYKVPRQLPFSRFLEHGWELTNLHSNKRPDVYKTLIRWQRTGSIPQLVEERQ